MRTVPSATCKPTYLNRVFIYPYLTLMSMLWLQTIIYLLAEVEVGMSCRHSSTPRILKTAPGSPGSNFYLQLVQRRCITPRGIYGVIRSGLSAPVQPNLWGLESFVPYLYLALRPTELPTSYLPPM